MIIHAKCGRVPTTLRKPEFDFECAQIVREIRMGIDHSVDEIADRLFIDRAALVLLAAGQHVRETGQPVVLVETENGGTVQ